MGESRGSAPAGLRPFVVVQNDASNQSRMGTVMVCALTSNLNRAAAPGNVKLEAGEAGLPRPSVVLVSQIFSVDKEDLGGKMGALSSRRILEIVDGLKMLLEPTD